MSSDEDKEGASEGLTAAVKARTTGFLEDLKRTLSEPVFVCTMLGYAVYTGSAFAPLPCDIPDLVVVYSQLLCTITPALHPCMAGNWHTCDQCLHQWMFGH